MINPVISYVEVCTPELVAYCTEVMHSHPELFPSYNKFDRAMLRQLLNSGINQHLRAVESGEFEEVKASIHQAFKHRVESGFHPNEIIRTLDLVRELVREAILHTPNGDAATKSLYCQRSESILQVAKMYTAILNLSIPKEERPEIEPSLLAL